MKKVQFRNVDLNLLIPLKALLHERNVTRAAERIHLSQSAMSRALDRLRSELGDELLVRVGRNYELTPRGSELLDELAQVMPRLARLWAGESFSPAHSEGHIRLAMNDYASSVVLEPLAEICGRLPFVLAGGNRSSSEAPPLGCACVHSFKSSAPYRTNAPSLRNFGPRFSNLQRLKVLRLTLIRSDSSISV
jgi:hypothetical protein